MNVFLAALGIPGAGKSTYLNLRFLRTQIVELDHCRALVCDDAGDQESTPDAADLMHHLLRIRCRRQILTAVDATNLNPDDRAKLLRHAAAGRMFTVALVFDTPEQLAVSRDNSRTRRVGAEVIGKMAKKFSETVPAAGAVPGFAQTVRISPTGQVTVHGLPTPDQFLPAPWLTPVLT